MNENTWIFWCIGLIAVSIVAAIVLSKICKNNPNNRFAKNKEERALEELEPYRKSYDSIFNNIEFPDNISTFRCNLSVFGTNSNYRINFCFPFYMWKDINTLYFFPEWEPIKQEHIHCISLKEKKNDVKDIRLDAIPIKDIESFKKQGEVYTETTISEGEEASSGSSMIGSKKKAEEIKHNTAIPDSGEVILKYKKDGELKILRLESRVYEIFQDWFPDKEYGYMMMNQSNQDIKSNSKAEDKLSELKSLLDKGLINEQDYADRKAKILDDF